MKSKVFIFAIFIFGFVAVFAQNNRSTSRLHIQNCELNNIPLYGRVQVVNHNADFRVQIVNSLPDLRVQRVDNFPNRCGRWQFVENQPDFTIQYVTSNPDFTIQFVENFSGQRQR